MKVVTRHFSGESPRTRAHELPEQLAQIAQDTILYRGAVQPLLSPQLLNPLYFEPVFNGQDPQVLGSLYRVWDDTTLEDRYWLWGRDLDDVIVDIGSDTRNRVIVFGDHSYYIFRVADFPSISSGGTGGNAILAVPRPSAPVVALAGSPIDTTLPQELIFVVSVVQLSTGREGPPSLISNPIDWSPGNTVHVFIPAPLNWIFGLDSIGYGYRIYVSSTDSTGNASFRFFQEIDTPQPDITAPIVQTFDFDPTLLGEALPSTIADQPPSDLHAVVMHPNGFVVGISGYKLVRSEVFEPHNYPQDYRDPIKHLPVALALIGQSVVIGTQQSTFMASGQDPLNVSIVELQGNYPCVSKQSMRTILGSVLYASPDGLASVGSDGTLTNFTQDIFTRDQWQAFNPASMRAVVFDNRYYCFYNNGTVKGCLIFDSGTAGITITRSSQHFDALYSDPLFDQMYGAQLNGAVITLFKWGAGPALQFLWKSKQHRMNRRQCMGAARVEADAYPVTFKFFADGALVHTQTVVDGFGFRMPDIRARQFEFQLEAVQNVTGVVFANTLAEVSEE